MTLKPFTNSPVLSTIVALALCSACTAEEADTIGDDVAEVEVKKPNKEPHAAILAIYGQPTDEQHFLDYYNSTHAPLADQLPGLITYHHGLVFGGNSDKFYEAVLTFASQQALLDALASPEGQAAVNDLPNFASGGVDIILSDHNEQDAD